MPQYQAGHAIDLLQGTREFFPALTAAMDAAQHDVHMESYIFDFTASGQEVAEALVRAAQRGLQVQLLVDGVGTERIPAEWRARFDATGVQWRIYNPLGPLGLLIPSRWRRLHRKLCVVDDGRPQAVGFCGGINVLDDFHDPNHGALSSPRFDFAVRVTGPLVDQIGDAQAAVWQRTQAIRKLREREFGAAIDAWTLARQSARLALAEPVRLAEATPEAHKAQAALVLRDNVSNRKRIERAYLKAIGEAQQEIIIANAYFLPGGKLRRALIQAAKRGVRVRLLLQGRYEYFMQYHAARPVYQVLLAAGVEIHEYAASFLHAKVAVVDAYSARAWATVGSSNLDPLSLLLAREANVMVRDGLFARELRERLDAAMTNEGQRIDAATFANRPLYKRVLDRVAFMLMRLALSITGNRY
jgi:cardiolipin synthase A/B